MKKINKLVTLLSVFLITSCSSNEHFSWKTYESKETSVTLVSEKYQNYEFSASLEGFTKIADDLLNAMLNKVSYEEYKKADVAYGEYYTKVVSDLLISRAFYFADLGEEYTKIYQEMSSITSLAYSYLNQYYMTAATSTDEIQIDYYGTSDDEEILEQLMGGGVVTPDYVLEANSNLNTINNEALILVNKYSLKEISEEEFINQGLDYFFDLKDNGQIVATYFGYDNYLDYLFAHKYSRSYTPDDVYSSFSCYVNQYITPLIKDYKFDVEKEDLTKKELEYYENLGKTYLGNKSILTGNLFSDFAYKMGGEYLSTYDHLWKDGYFIFTNKDNSQGTANVVPGAISSVGEPIVYFSKDYQDVFSVVHEFGHYLNGYLNYSSLTSLDIDEVFSQANENLFLNYLYHNYSNKKYQKAINYFIEHKAFDFLKTIAQGLVCFDAEYYAYNNDVDKATLKQKLLEIGDSYKDYLGEQSTYYFMYGLVYSPGYFISYATSVVAAIEYFCKAEVDFDTAKVDYMNLVNSQNRSMSDYYTVGNVYSPFSEECYKYIAENHPFFNK